MERRDLNLKNLDEVLVEIHRLSDGGYDKLGQWDLAQVCHHCASPIEQTIDGYTFRVPLPIRLIIIVTGAKRKFFRRRDIKPGLSAPATTLPPEGLETAEQIKRYEAAVKRLKTHTGDFHAHPFFGTMTPDAWEQFHTIHTMHHLRFLRPHDPGAGG